MFHDFASAPAAASVRLRLVSQTAVTILSWLVSGAAIPISSTAREAVPKVEADEAPLPPGSSVSFAVYVAHAGAV